MAKSVTVPVEQLSEETRALFDVLNEERDVAVILIATSFLDACLKSNLEHKLLASQTTDKLLRHTGVLGTLNARADMCYALGLIPKSWYQNLCTFAEIRNLVAHHHLSLSFETPEIAAKVEALTTPLGGPLGLELEGRSRFTLVSALLANQLLLGALSLQSMSKTVAPAEPRHVRMASSTSDTSR